MKNLMSSLRYYRDNYDFNHRLDDNLSTFKNCILIAICALCYYTGLFFIIRLVSKKLVEKKRLKSEKTVAFIFSKNHKIVYKELVNLGFDFPHYDLSFSVGHKENLKNGKQFTQAEMLLAALANSKYFLDLVFENKEDELAKNNRFKLLKIVGYAFIFEVLLTDLKLAVKFNDHVFNNVLLSDMCLARKIKTVYFQHAPVSYRFPALHHDLNVLFSPDSAEKYRVEDPSKEVFRFVDIRLLVSRNFEKHSTPIPKNVLIAINQLDSIEELSKLIEAIQDKYYVYLRIHPRDTRDFRGLLKYTNLTITKGTTIWEDMNKCSIVVCNETAVPLEALYYNRLVYKAAFLSPSMDNYSFLKQGLLLKEYDDVAALLMAMNNRDVSSDKTKLAHYIGEIEDYKRLTEALKNKIERLL